MSVSAQSCRSKSTHSKKRTTTHWTFVKNQNRICVDALHPQMNPTSSQKKPTSPQKKPISLRTKRAFLDKRMIGTLFSKK